MALIKTVRGKTPSWGKNCFLAENATLTGDIEMGNDCSIWFQAVLRGDVNSIRIGNKVNIQDGAVVHCTYQKTKTIIGHSVSIGHRALVHGCTIGNKVLVGMGAIIMDNAVVPDNCLIAAGALILENAQLESNAVYAGVPAKKIKSLSPELFKNEIERIAEAYMMYASWYEEEEK